jgi:hypothetical protein
MCEGRHDVVRVGMRGTGRRLTGLFVLLAAAGITGCGDPSIGIDLTRDLKAGMVPSEVEALLGAPSERGEHTNYDPPLVYLKYEDWGLTLEFSPIGKRREDGPRGPVLFQIFLEKRLEEGVFGARVGDSPADVASNPNWQPEDPEADLKQDWTAKDVPGWSLLVLPAGRKFEQQVIRIRFVDGDYKGAYEITGVEYR